jgi:TPR repeat protein
MLMRNSVMACAYRRVRALQWIWCIAPGPGDAEAQFFCAQCLKGDSGVSIDFRRAAHDFKPAADQGLAIAQCFYGEMLRIGDGVPIDPCGGAHYFKLAADQGEAIAQFGYGTGMMFRWICNGAPVISNLLQTKDLLMLSLCLVIVLDMAEASRLI